MRVRVSLFLLLLLPFLALALPTRAATPEVTVSAAISLRETIQQLAAGFQKETGTKVNLNLGASGQLESQIAAGAPVDVFVAAGVKQVEELIKGGQAEENSREIVARNRVVLIVPKGAKSAVEIRGFADLTSERVTRIAIGQQKVVPAGDYAVQVLKAARVWEGVQSKLVYAASVRQVLDYVERGEVDAGIVYATDAIESAGKVRVAAVADESMHDPVVYPAVVIKGGNEAAGRAFVKYLTGEKGQAVFRQHGFEVGASDKGRGPNG